jgi:hypothetical protein
MLFFRFFRGEFNISISLEIKALIIKLETIANNRNENKDLLDIFGIILFKQSVLNYI